MARHRRKTPQLECENASHSRRCPPPCRANAQGMGPLISRIARTQEDLGLFWLEIWTYDARARHQGRAYAAARVQRDQSAEARVFFSRRLCGRVRGFLPGIVLGNGRQ